MRRQLIKRTEGKHGDRGRAAVPASRLGAAVRQLTSRQRNVLGISHTALLIWDITVLVSTILTDDEDRRPWSQRLDDALNPVLEPGDEAAKLEIQQHLASFAEAAQSELPAWARRVDRQDTRRFLRRALGAAAYDRLAAALKSDGAVVVVALRRGSRLLMPYAAALDDVATVLTPGEIAACAPLDALRGTMVSLILQIDGALDKLVGMGLVLAAVTGRPEEQEAFAVEDLEAFVSQLRVIVAGKTKSQVADLNSALVRKMQGARDALEHSADPVSQASSSLIELLDRLLRTAFDDEEVLAWAGEQYPGDAGLTYVKDGRVRPTKRAQALCFAYAGERVAERSALNELLAAEIVTARAKLQQLKHADTGSPEEAAQLARCLAAVEGSLHLALGFAWATAPDDKLDRLRARFALSVV